MPLRLLAGTVCAGVKKDDTWAGRQWRAIAYPELVPSSTGVAEYQRLANKLKITPTTD
jgi:hypothetical protein